MGSDAKFAFNKALSLILNMLILAASLGANLRKEYQALESSYQQGKINEIAASLPNLQPKSNEEKALLLFLRAMVESKKSEVSYGYLQQAVSSYPNTYYGQLSMLQQAKLLILERKAGQAKTTLEKINSTQIAERYYWLAVCAEMMDAPNLIISNAENYQRLEPKGEYLEESYYLIANAYLEQAKYQSAISTLNKLAAIGGYPTDAQYFHYLLGFAYHRAGNWQEALSSYKKGIKVSSYSQLAYLIEDQLFDLKQKYGSKVDLSFLYPYQSLEITEVTPIETPNSEIKEVQTATADLPYKVSSKLEAGLYLQTGRFGVEANARSIAFRIRELKLPSGYFEDKSKKDIPWVTFCGPFKTAAEQENAMKLLKENKIDSFKVRY